MPSRIGGKGVAGLIALVVKETAAQRAPKTDGRDVSPLRGIVIMIVRLILNSLFAQNGIVSDARVGQRIDGRR